MRQRFVRQRSGTVQYEKPPVQSYSQSVEETSSRKRSETLKQETFGGVKVSSKSEETGKKPPKLNLNQNKDDKKDTSSRSRTPSFFEALKSPKADPAPVDNNVALLKAIASGSSDKIYSIQHDQFKTYILPPAKREPIQNAFSHFFSGMFNMVFTSGSSDIINSKDPNIAKEVVDLVKYIITLEEENINRQDIPFAYALKKTADDKIKGLAELIKYLVQDGRTLQDAKDRLEEILGAKEGSEDYKLIENRGPTHFYTVKSFFFSDENKFSQSYSNSTVESKLLSLHKLISETLVNGPNPAILAQ